ncbi:MULTISPECIES: Shedu immune nuclease family protein [Streptomyces]|uniref:Shedu immune nuclease family protein n=1 Tax=Streptomyces TaxID=1883 RepID=UPI000E6A77B0|nr:MULTISPECIES: Shedu immune nuclease family protein [Streptomyces]MDX3065815.1 DUF4263 domain-containing protein [Streptomyces sp. ND04-05B]MDX3519689.1 DUF4263 domain-containing protein [Streptomyces scabiei]
MAEADWKKVAAHLRELSGEATPAQRDIADALGVPLTPGTPMPVAAALLRAHLTGPLRLKRAQPIDEEEYGYLELVAGEAAVEVPSRDLIAHRDILEAWLEVAWAHRSVIHLERLSPEPGDIAITPGQRDSDQVQHDIIASISNSGRLNFRGGLGRGARPHRVTSLVKQDAPDHADFVRKAREEALARDPHPGRVTSRELALLRPWQVTRRPSLAEQEALRETLETATAERDLQEVLQRHPALLGHVLTGNHGTWVRPEVGFGNHYRADFLIAGRTSAGLQWVLVELESPNARLTNRGNGRESPTLRHAVDQIRDWREWLSTNLLQARTPRTENGLSLPGITADARGLIIMGREDDTEDSAQVRRRLFTDSRIEVRTFDWLLRAAEQADSRTLGLLDLEAGDDTDEW